MEVYLIDGTFELFRSYYGAPSSVVNGKEVGAVRGLLRSLWNLVREREVKFVGCAFDHTIESFRNELYSGYKTGEGIEPDLFDQFQLAENVVEALGICVWPMVEFEADDALATAALKISKKDPQNRVIICSPDKDLCQCVVENQVVCWDRMREKWLDRSGVVEKFGVEPASIPDWLALVGDAADGIPGIPRWGKKSAATVLAAFSDVEKIPDSIQNWPKVRGAQGLSQTLSENREEVKLYKKLATLRTDVPISCELEDLQRKTPATEKLRELCSHLDENNFFTRYFQNPV